MNPTTRLQMTNWLAGEGLTGLAENDLVRGFCERCRAAGLDLSRGLVFIDTPDPVFEGHGFRWSDTQTNESDAFDYGSPNGGEDAAKRQRCAVLHTLENHQPRQQLDLPHCAAY